MPINGCISECWCLARCSELFGPEKPGTTGCAAGLLVGSALKNGTAPLTGDPYFGSGLAPCVVMGDATAIAAEAA